MKTEVMSSNDFFRDNLDTLAVVPFVSVAVPFDELAGAQSHMDCGAFAHLPFKKNTGLPFHVNAGFNLESNRAGLFCDLDGENHPKRKWNRLLLEESSVFAEAVERVSLHLSQCTTTTSMLATKNAIYDLWPAEEVDADFVGVAQHFHHHIKDRPMLFCDSDGTLKKLRDVNVLCLKQFEEGGVTAESVYKVLAASSKTNVAALPAHVWEIVGRRRTDVRNRVLGLTAFFNTIMLPHLRDNAAVFSGMAQQQNSMSDSLNYNEVGALLLFYIDTLAQQMEAVGQRAAADESTMTRTSSPSSWNQILSACKIFPTSAGTRSAINTLYHPDVRKNESTSSLLPDEKFPHSDLLTPQRLNILCQAGVLRKEISWEDMKELAKRSVESKDTVKLRKLFEYFVRAVNKMRDADRPPDAAFVDLRSNLPWIPQLRATEKYPNWSDFVQFRTLSAVRHYRWLKSAFLVQPIIDYDIHFTDTFLKKMDWFELKSGLLAQQIAALSDIYAGQPANKKSEYVDYLQAALKKLSVGFRDIGAEREQKKKNQTKQDRDVLRNFNFLPVVEQGVLVMKPTKKFLRSEEEFPPFRYRLPDKLQEIDCSEILSDFGVVKNVGDLQSISNILRSIVSEAPDFQHSSDLAVDSVVRLIGKMAQMVQPSSRITSACAADRETFYCLLCSDGRLMPSRHVFVNDMNHNMGLGRDLELPGGSWREVHPKVPPADAQKLGATLLSALIRESDGVPLHVGGTSFGQRAESVDVSIRNKLADMEYEGCGFRLVFTETLANAHDKGARGLHVVLDERDHGVEGTFGSHMADVQGPALVFGMDSEFDESDWAGVEYIGETFKDDTFIADGQFGIKTSFSAQHNILSTHRAPTAVWGIQTGSTTRSLVQQLQSHGPDRCMRSHEKICSDCRCRTWT